MIYVTDDNFKTEVLKSDIPVIVDFYADWCNPCKVMTPMLEEISQERTDIKFVKIDVDVSYNTTMEYGIRNIPTFLMFKNGEVQTLRVGGTSKSSIIDWIDEGLNKA